MFRLGGYTIGDAWYYEADDGVHAYFLVKPEGSDDSSLGPFHVHGAGEIMPEAPPVWWYASQLVRHGGEWSLLGAVRDDAGRTAVSDPMPVVADETGIHAAVHPVMYDTRTTAPPEDSR